MVISLLLIYTAVVMPLRVAFYSPVYWDGFTAIELGVDILFGVDVFVNSFSSFETYNGQPEYRFRVIFWRYFKTWFIIDLAACIPFDVIDHL